MKKTTYSCLAVDLESWVFSKKINALQLSTKELRQLDNNYLPHALDSVLKILKKYDQKITFFVVTKLEDMYPGTLDKIKKDGHEIGWHTHTHRKIDSKEVLLEELHSAKKYIDHYRIKGFQAPEIYFIKEGYKILRDFGFTYSSSIYGNTNKRYVFDDIVEIPVSVSNKQWKPIAKEVSFPSNLEMKKILTYGIPFGSSFFWGIFGRRYYAWKLREEKDNKRNVNLFIHEWQLIQPRSKQYKKDVSFLWNPLFYPYKIPVMDTFVYLVSHFKFVPLRTLV